MHVLELYFSYLRERDGLSVLATDQGLVLHKELDGRLYVETMYILPEFRGQGYAAKLMQQCEIIAKQLQLRGLVTSCAPSDKACTKNIHSILVYGFNILSVSPDLIWAIKDFEGNDGQG